MLEAGSGMLQPKPTNLKQRLENMVIKNEYI